MEAGCKAFEPRVQRARPSAGSGQRRLKPQATEPPTAQTVVLARTNRRRSMMKGGLLWLIGIPLPIILILFFLGYLH
jgi:hypothetical protein